MSTEYVTIKQAADIIGVTPAAIRTAIRQERLAAVKQPTLILRSDVLAYKKGKKTMTEKQVEANRQNLTEGRRKSWSAERRQKRAEATKAYWENKKAEAQELAQEQRTEAELYAEAEIPLSARLDRARQKKEDGTK